MVFPTSYLDVTPPGTTADQDQFREDRDVMLPLEIGSSPPFDPNDPDSSTQIAEFRTNRTLVLAELTRRTRLMRVALANATAAGTAATPPVVPGTGTQGAAIPPTAPNVPVGGVMTQPRCGGISTNFGVQMVWTGGGRHNVPSRLTEPKSILAFRPSDFKEHARIVKDVQTGLSDEHRLGVPQDIFKEGGISFHLWNQKIKTEIEDRGMDGEFRILSASNTETYLLDEFGKATHDMVVNWVDGLRATNPCRYEEQNMKMSGKFLLSSIKVELLEMVEMVERNICENPSGPEVYTAIVNLHQRVSTSAVRKLIEVLEKMTLKSEPGEDVQKFCGKVTDVAKRIIGTGSPPNDLVALIYKPFTKCSVETFRNAANTYYERADEMDPTYDNWETWLLKLQMRYQRDCDNGEWEPLKHNKESAALAGTVAGGTDTRTCYHCGKTGHIKPNCPDKDKPAVAGVTASSGGSRSTLRVPPNEGASHTKMIDGHSHSWCSVCKRWNTGKKAHLTNEHKSKAKTEEVKVPEVSTVIAPTVLSAVSTVESGPTTNLGSVAAGSTSNVGGQPFIGNGFMGYVGMVADRPQEPTNMVDCWFDDLDEADFRDCDLQDIFHDHDNEESGLLEEAVMDHSMTKPTVKSLNFRAGRCYSRAR